MLTKRLARAACAVAMVASLVAFTGCGGSDNKSSSNTSTTATPTATTPAGNDTAGGGSLADYKAGAEKAATDFKNSAQAASAKVQAATDANGKVAGLEALKASVSQAADAFEALSPPANLKADNAELVAEFRSLATTVDDVESALKSNDATKAQAALPKLQQTQAKIGQTIARIQAKLGG